jgi:metal-sulfur cluster biosynthetic enzyme
MTAPGDSARDGSAGMASAAAGPGLTLEDAAWNALAGVYDPELYLDVVSLGLVYSVRAENDALVVEMTLTTPGCPVSESLPEQAKGAVQEAVGDAAVVDVRVIWDPPWSPAMMQESAATELGFRSPG